MRSEPRGLIETILTCLLVCSLAPMARSAATAAVDSPGELQSMFDQGQYSQTLSKLNATLAKTPDSDKDTRCKLLMLKGEALLRTKAYDSSMDAFKAAVLVGPDDHSIAMARANAALLKRSSLGKYQPKTKPTSGTAAGTLPQAIDIVDPASRKFAFAALFTDLMTTAKPQIEKAEKLTTLPPIEDVATQFSDLRPLEIASTGSDTDSKALMKKLGDQASKLMNAALKNLDSQIAAISRQATARQKRDKLKGSDLSDGLLPDDVGSLDSIVSQAEQIGTTAVSMQSTFGDAETFKSVETDALKTIDTANKLLKQYKHAAAS